MKNLSFLIVMITFCGLNAAIGQWANNIPHINNTNSGNVGIGNGSLWTPTEKLHVKTFGAGIAGIMAENSVPGNGTVGYFRIKNSASGYMFNMVLRKVGGSHEMLQSCYDASTGLWREYAYFNFANRKYEMRNGVMDAEFLNAGKFLISSIGHTGIGVANPLEKLDVNGAIRIGNTANNNTGSIRWDGSNFQGRNTTGWVNLDAQPIAHSLLQDIENSIFVVTASNYTVPSNKNLLLTTIYFSDVSTKVTINSIQNLCYYGTHDWPIILSPADQIDIPTGTAICGQLIPLKYTSVYQDITNNPFIVPASKNLVLTGVFNDCFTNPPEIDDVLINSVSLGSYLPFPLGLAFPLVLNSGMTISTSNATHPLVISGYLIDE
jgi:hypothetical protein